MKKIMGLLVAGIALSVVMSGCSKPEETTTPEATAGGTTATTGNTAGAPAATAGSETPAATAGGETTGK